MPAIMQFFEKWINENEKWGLIVDVWLNNKWICLQLKELQFVGETSNTIQALDIPLIDPKTCWLTTYLQFSEKK